ncbi:tRNA(fMet)-specific endonuclease VapC [Fundidesulfovibrio magnetotacticus]|uniref:Ribonuclease VapC n=2 Tax=Fundidesulfovibrio magnetotacticus TaxID=2730080 RepID=A0A6V8LXN5_9BACT|nr:tRNA(fMet)-specific endonuclease VapC [Fundidesulfovibrio magnetotacticus]
MLDTNICVYVLNRQPPEVRRRFAAHPFGQACISAITLAELESGVAASRYRQENTLALQALLDELVMLPFDATAARHFGDIRTELKRSGTPIGPMDMLIAAHARSLGLTLVTNNVREFARVPGLAVENWLDGLPHA